MKHPGARFLRISGRSCPVEEVNVSGDDISPSDGFGTNVEGDNPGTTI